MLDVTYRIAVGLVGLAVVIVGVIALPAPGPGWAIIFVGLGILATEFVVAQRLLHWVRLKYNAWVAWMGRQHRSVQLLVSGAILLFVALCAWLVGVFGTVGGWVGVDWPWLQSPLRSLL